VIMKGGFREVFLCWNVALAFIVLGDVLAHTHKVGVGVIGLGHGEDGG
jgi:hypothetical protein